MKNFPNKKVKCFLDKIYLRVCCSSQDDKAETCALDTIFEFYNYLQGKTAFLFQHFKNLKLFSYCTILKT